MTTVSIFPIPSPGDSVVYHAVAGQSRSVGATAGQALDAVSALLSPDELRTLVVVQHMQPDRLFTAKQQERLAELMDRWRRARAGEGSFSEQERAELDDLVEQELQASGERAKRIGEQLEL